MGWAVPQTRLALGRTTVCQKTLLPAPFPAMEESVLILASLQQNITPRNAREKHQISQQPAVSSPRLVLPGGLSIPYSSTHHSNLSNVWCLVTLSCHPLLPIYPPRYSCLACETSLLLLLVEYPHPYIFVCCREAVKGMDFWANHLYHSSTVQLVGRLLHH